MAIVTKENKTYSVNLRDEEYIFNIINQVITLTSFVHAQQRAGRPIGMTENQASHLLDLSDKLVDFVAASKMPSTHTVDADFDDAYSDDLRLNIDGSLDELGIDCSG